MENNKWDFSRHHTSKTLKQFANYFKSVSDRVGFKMSSRGWCYILEQDGVITKDQFSKGEELINRCRRRGLLPVDFVAEEEARDFLEIHIPDDPNKDQFLLNYLKYFENAEYYYHPDWWEGEKFYIQMLVEKIDLRTLFQPICSNYHIPIATSKGWSSILQRALYARRFKQAEEDGKQCILLYCGDHDPDGLRISDFIRSNLEQIKDIVWENGEGGYDPENLQIMRFGLNYDFILKNNLTWIDNLITGSGKDLASKNHKNNQMPYVQNYIKTIGVRKCEANSIVVNPDSGRELCVDTIEEILGDDCLDRFKQKRDKAIRDIKSIKEDNNINALLTLIKRRLE